MTLKTHIAGSLVTMVTLLMLVTVIMPHHHHEEEVCFAETHCKDEVSHPIPVECNSSGEHQHDREGDQDNCRIQHVFLLPHLKSGHGDEDLVKMLRNVIASIPVVLNETCVLEGIPGLITSPPPLRACSGHAGNPVSPRAPPVSV
mgnify:CR=1 FL=1